MDRRPLASTTRAKKNRDLEFKEFIVHDFSLLLLATRLCEKADRLKSDGFFDGLLLLETKEGRYGKIFFPVVGADGK